MFVWFFFFKVFGTRYLLIKSIFWFDFGGVLRGAGGQIERQYEAKYWWFECFIITHKMLMTGALVIIAKGSTVQPLVAVLFQLAFLLAVLKLAPVRVFSCNRLFCSLDSNTKPVYVLPPVR